MDKNPTTVVIYIGINDVWHSLKGTGTSPERFEAGLQDIIKKITDTGAKVILCTPSVIGEKTDASNELDSMLEQFAAISRRVASKSGANLLDLRQLFQQHLAANNPLNRGKNILTNDGVHLNDAGNDFVARQMLTALGQDHSSVKYQSLMQHIVLFKFKDETSPADIDEIVLAFDNLPSKIDQIIGYSSGTNVSPEKLAQGYTHALVVSFRDAAGRDAYLPHRAHKQFVKLLDGKIDKVLVFDFATGP